MVTVSLNSLKNSSNMSSASCSSNSGTLGSTQHSSSQSEGHYTASRSSASMSQFRPAVISSANFSTIGANAGSSALNSEVVMSLAFRLRVNPGIENQVSTPGRTVRP